MGKLAIRWDLEVTVKGGHSMAQDGNAIRELLADIQSQKTKLAAELDDLAATERVLLKRLGNKAETSRSTMRIRRRRTPLDPEATEPASTGAKRYEQCAQVLKENGKPTPTPVIASRILDMGIGTDVHNIGAQIFTAMKRRPDIFVKQPNGWALREWAK